MEIKVAQRLKIKLRLIGKTLRFIIDDDDIEICGKATSSNQNCMEKLLYKR